MEIKKFTELYFDEVYNVIHKTIEETYPKYYPRSAVDFFHNHHSKENMEKLLPNETTLILWDKKIIGTGSLSGNELKRFFILPEYQGKGFGKLLLRELEKNIDKNKYDNFVLDSSLGAVEFYQKNGYVFKKYMSINLSDGNYLCYLEMIKYIEQKICA